LIILDPKNQAIRFIEKMNHIPDGHLTKFCQTTFPITYYERIIYDTIVQKRRRFKDIILKNDNGKIVGINLKDIDKFGLREHLKKEFKLMLRNEIGTQNDILIDELNQLGISLEKGSVYFDYSTAIKDGGLMTFRPKSQARGSCAFSLGCTSHFDQLSIDNEHPLPRSRGSNLEGSQDMCTWHNQMKRDSMLFDHHSIHDLIFDTKRA